MDMNEIRARANQMNIGSNSMNKIEMIRCIQEKEGNIPCFKTNQSSCDQYECSWRGDCQPGALIARPRAGGLYIASTAPVTTP